MIKNNKRPLQQINDGYSCGPLVIYYAECVKSRKDFDVELNLENYRRHVIEVLLEKSINMQKICLHCAIDIEDTYYEYNKCERQVHKLCAWLSVIGLETVPIADYKKIKQTTEIPNPFTCQLCKINNM